MIFFETLKLLDLLSLKHGLILNDSKANEDCTVKICPHLDAQSAAPNKRNESVETPLTVFSQFKCTENFLSHF